MIRLGLSAAILALIALGGWGWSQYRAAENARSATERLAQRVEALAARAAAQRQALTLERRLGAQTADAMARLRQHRRALEARLEALEHLRPAIEETPDAPIDALIADVLERLRCARDPASCAPGDPAGADPPDHPR